MNFYIKHITGTKRMHSGNLLRLILFTLVVLVFSLAQKAYSQTRYWVASSPGNWNDTNNWSSTSGTGSGASVPASGNLAVFDGVNGKNGACNLDIAPTVGGITVNGYTGTITFTNSLITTGANNSFSTGSLSGSGSLMLSGSTSTAFGGTSVGVSVSGTTASIQFNGSTFSKSITVTKTGAFTDGSSGNNTFGAAVMLTNSGTGDMQLGNSSGDTFNSDLTLSNTGTGSIFIANSGTTNFNGNVAISNSPGASNKGIYFSNTSGSSIQTTGSFSLAGAFSGGELRIRSFSQAAANAINITLTGNAIMHIGDNIVGGTNGNNFMGNVTFKAPSITIDKAVYNGTAYFEKTSSTGIATADLGIGECTFNSTATFVNNSGASGGALRTNGGNTFANAVAITNSSAKEIALEYVSGYTSTYNSTVSYTNSFGDINAAYNGTTNFNGNIILVSNTNSNSTNNGVFFGKSTGTATLVGSISTSGTFDSGTLSIQNLTQSGGSGSTITLTSASVLSPSTLQVGPGNTFNNDVNFKASVLLLNGGIYKANSTFEKTGGTVSDAAGLGGNIFGDAVTDMITITNSSTTGADLKTNGGNTFNGTTSINNTGTGDISLEYGTGLPTTYNAPLTLTNSPASMANVNITVGYNGSTTINGNITLNSTGNGGNNHGIFLGDESGGGSVILSNGYSMSLGAMGSFNAGNLRFVNFTQSGGTPQSLALTAWSATVNAGFIIGPNSTFNGSVTFSAPSVVLDGCTYNSTANITKNSSPTTPIPDSGRGGNRFNSTTTIRNTSNGCLGTAALVSGSGDTFNGVLTLSNSSSGSISLAGRANSTVFNDNIICNSTGSGGIYIGYNPILLSGATSSLLDGKTITGTSNNGTVQLTNFTQGSTVGGIDQSLNFTGTTSLILGPSTIFYSNVTFLSPRVFLNGAIYYGTADITKSGVSPDAGAGGNTFKKKVKLSNTYTATADATGIFQTANGSPDVFEDDLTLNNSGNGSISLAYNNPTVTQFKKNVIFNSTNSLSASGVYIGLGGGVGATLAAGFKLLTGNDPLVSPAGSGVTGGKVYLGRLQQPAGVTDTQSMTFTNTALLHISNSYFRGDINSFTAPRILLDATTFEGINTFVKTGSVNDDCGGGNTFTGGGSSASYSKTTTLTSTGSGYWAFSNPGPADTFSGPLTINNNGTNNINMANNVTGATPTTFNNSVTFNCTSASFYITVGTGNSMSNPNPAGALFTAPGVVTASGGVISMTSPAAATAGIIAIGKADVYGSQSITATTGQLIIGGAAPYMPATYKLPSHFRGDLVVQQNRVTVQYSTFDGNTSIEKTGGSTDTSSGSNTFGDTSADAIQIKNSAAGTFTLGGDIFNGATTGTNSSTGTLSLPGADTFNASVTFTNSSTGTLSLAGTDAYNSGASFNNTSTGSLLPANTGTSSFYGDISTNASSAIVFGNGGGNVTFTGASNQSINKTVSTSSPKFTAINLSKTAGAITLNTDITISATASVTTPFVFFTKASVGGIINSTNTNIVKFDDNAVVQGTVSNASHINGPVQKTGNDAFTFPTGNNGIYRAIAISTPSSTSDVFAAQYFKSSPISAIGSTKAAALNGISDCEYWLLNHTTGTSSVTVTLNWVSSDCADYSITDLTKLSVAQWDGTKWIDDGNNGGAACTACPFAAGTILSTGTIANFGTSLASVTSYAPFTVATTNSVNSLPIELSSFNVQKVSPGKVRLVWRTESEINNMGFEIQKSFDGAEFHKLGFVAGQGTTTTANEYNFEDGHISLRNYYRLKQVDYDGKYTLTTVRFIQTDSEVIDLVVAPNPFTDLKPGKIIIEGCSPEIDVQLEVISSSGVHLKFYNGSLEDINTKFALDIQSLEAGLYFVRALLMDRHKVLVDRIIKN